MSGIVHLRIVVILFIVGGILALLPYALSLFLEDVEPSPFGWVGGAGSIALAAWLSRGSNAARITLIFFSVLGLLFYGILLFMTLRDSWSTAAVLGIFGILCVYCLWALAFSKGVRAELARRRDANTKQEPGAPKTL
jgi:ABC-type cobalamin transport system permease subunit